MIPPFPRDMLSRVFNGDQRMVLAFEELVARLTTAAEQAEGASGAAGTLATAEILTLAPSDLPAAKVLVPGTGIDLAPDGTIATDSTVPASDGGRVIFLVTGDTDLFLPATGVVATTQDIMNYIASAEDYADDAAAAAGGVAVGRIYRTASVLKVRVA